MMARKAVIKVYNGFGQADDLVVFGHVFNHPVRRHHNNSTNIFANLYQLVKLFVVKPLPGVPVQLNWKGKITKSVTEKDGFFWIEWNSSEEVPAGWHPVRVEQGSNELPCKPGNGEIFVPHKTQFVFVSDIDDTVLVSHSYTKLRRLRELLFNKPHSRLVFPDVAKHYNMLAQATVDRSAPNPFFYVSSSEWNLYGYLNDFFSHNGLPKGSFLLSQVKRWYQLFRTGKSRHEGKLVRITRLLKIFPGQRFVLFGDNSQHDPELYATLSERYSDRIYAVYIRNVKDSHREEAMEKLALISQKNIHTCLFNDSGEAIAHSREIGLLPNV